MRWSLILSAFIAVQSVLSFVCVALAIPPSSDGLERRARRVRKAPDSPKESSKIYRENSKLHHYAYDFDKATGVTREKLKKEDRLTKGESQLKKKNNMLIMSLKFR